MASSNTSRDTDVPNPKSTSDNPFVKFRNVVDYHVGSVLQGIIGLPTILSRDPNSGNGRWAGLDGDSERPQDDSRRTRPQDRTSESTEAPAKEFHGFPPRATGAFEPSGHGGDDWDLYSVFDDSCVDRIERTAKEHPWLGIRRGEKFQWRATGTDGEDNVQKGIQLRFLASLADLQTTYGYEDPSDVREKTLAPYLLFSPYSPLALMGMPPIRPRDDPFWFRNEQFTYCDAFEDLLRVSIDEPMRDLRALPIQKILWALKSGRGIWQAARDGLVVNKLGDNLTFADMGMVWMETALVDSDVFHEDSLYEKVDFDPLFGPIYEMKPSLMSSVPRNFMAHLEDRDDVYSQEAQTEQEMYDRFFQSASNTMNDSKHLSSTVIELLSMLQQQGLALRDVFNDPYFESRSRASKETPHGATQSESSEFNGRSTPTATPGDAHRKSAAADMIKMPPSFGDLMSEVPTDDRVISETTSTTQQTEEDGTVRTTVIVKKELENGRKSVTVTTHVQSPSSDEQEEKQGNLQGVDDDAAKGDGKNVNGNAKKGWFWN